MSLTSSMKAFIPAPLKRLAKGFMKRSARERFEREAVRLDEAAIATGLRAAGLERGDALFVHSSLKGLGFIEGGAATVIAAFQEVVGPDGLLVFPTFTINGSMQATLSDAQRVFDPTASPSTVGAITNTFWRSPGVLRSSHPTHSVAAWGRDAHWLVKDHHTASSNFGIDTPFGRFLELNGKVVGLGIGFGPVTFYHVVEDLHPDQFPGVYLAGAFGAQVKLPDGSLSTMSTRCHAPAHHARRIDKDAEIETYWAGRLLGHGIAHRNALGQGAVWWMRAAELVKEQEAAQRQGISIYSIPEGRP